MATQDLETRVENIEQTLTILSTIPERLGTLETQFLQFREETRHEFSAIHGELYELRGGQDRLSEGQERLASQMRMLYKDLVERIKWLGEGRTG